jgi:formylglycine-generating enzyme required for sulfatase activity
MQKVLLGLVIALSLVVGAGAPAAPDSGGARVALVIGNGAYENTAHLPNPVHDAADIAAALEKLHYSVQLLTDASKAGMEAALARFSREVSGADQAFIYYAGHGIVVGGVNYLLPVEARVESERSVPLEAVALPTVMGVAQGAHLGIVVLDACRNNPLVSHLQNAGGARALARGLAAVDPAGSNLLVAYATRDGHVAADGTGRNSPYTLAILQTLQEPGLEVNLFWRKVRDRVLAATQSQQEPFTYGSLSSEQLYINPPAGPPPAGPQYDRELVMWQGAQALGTADAYREYLSHYPQGQYSGLAKLQIAALIRPAPEASPGAAFRDCAGCPEIVMIPAGHFLMGSPPGQGQADQHPQHRVDVAAFGLGKYDVTFDEWDACVMAHGCPGRSDSGWGRGRRPVIGVTWDDSQTYLRWLSRTTGHTYRLPSEAEWEYAARAGTTSTYYWGDALGQGHANCDGCGSRWDNQQTAPVGSFAPNSFGLYDMAGNVNQWTQDCENNDYNGAPADGSAWLSGNCSARVDRGGSWLLESAWLCSACRSPDAGANARFGFRVARTR